MTDAKPPLPMFDSLEHIDKAIVKKSVHAKINDDDFYHSLAFLKCYKGSVGTFNSYRREVERVLQWSCNIANMSLKQIKRADIEDYIKFCQNPPKSWIGIKKAPRFIERNGERVPNPEWRPFVATISKASHRLGRKVDIDDFNLSQGAIKELFAILSTYFNYLIQEEYMFMNPVALIRQKSKFIRKQQSQTQIRRLTSLQWEYVIETAAEMAVKNPDKYERTLFIMTALYCMYLRISELAASERWTPKMCDFYRDRDGNWWFKTVGKGNKERQIAVSNKMLDCLTHYRLHLGLTALPSLVDKTPLLMKSKGKGAITSTTYIREIVQNCFDAGILQLEKDGHHEEAESLIEATVHWLRHTGISDDVQHRPREHVRDDAGHSSSATTDKYIDVELRERHLSAKNKPIFLDK
ncbi:MAG: site-specific integrase [Legionellaceae bacterium]|nr:site-specific integrase [Legionellaceae bacterium]